MIGSGNRGGIKRPQVGSHGGRGVDHLGRVGSTLGVGFSGRHVVKK